MNEQSLWVRVDGGPKVDTAYYNLSQALWISFTPRGECEFEVPDGKGPHTITGPLATEVRRRLEELALKA